MVTEYTYTVARETYGTQDKETRAAIDKMWSVLVKHSTGSKLNVSEEVIKNALFVIAVDITKDLALLGIKVEQFIMPTNICIKCGGEV